MKEWPHSRRKPTEIEMESHLDQYNQSLCVWLHYLWEDKVIRPNLSPDLSLQQALDLGSPKLLHLLLHHRAPCRQEQSSGLLHFPHFRRRLFPASPNQQLVLFLYEGRVSSNEPLRLKGPSCRQSTATTLVKLLVYNK